AHEKRATTSFTSGAPTLMTSLRLPGEPAVEQPEPALPAEKTGMIPAARQAWTVAREKWSSGLSLPHELLTTSGRFDGSALAPARSVGARMNWPAERREPSVQPKSS